MCEFLGVYRIEKLNSNFLILIQNVQKKVREREREDTFIYTVLETKYFF
jgi:hypothetical protein